MYDLVIVFDIVYWVCVMYLGWIVEESMFDWFFFDLGYFYICVFIVVVLMMIVG